jgi:5-methylphenazine-1-carboxylate 1-monooxygenase
VAERSPKFVVVGAGIGGLATALSLAQVGVEAEIYETVKAIRPLGVGINLLPHAVRELDELGLLDRLVARSVCPETLVYFTRRGQEIWREPRGIVAGYAWPQVSIHRGVLQELLLGAFLERLGPGRLHLDHRLQRVDERAGRPVAVFADREVVADAVVAADGIHSTLRSQRYPAEGSPIWNGSLLWRGVTEIDPVLDGRTLVWAGHPDQKFVGYPIQDLPSGRQLFNFVAELRRPHSDLAGAQDWNRLGSLDDFLPDFEEWRFDWLDVPAAVRSCSETFLFPMVDREPVGRWTFGPTTLLGDAAHPMYPIGSNGASQAVIDARILAGCVRRHPSNLGEALTRYEQIRRPATAAIVAANRGLGPERPMLLVEQRAPGGFKDIAEVITPAEIAEVTNDYRRTAGFAIADLKRRATLIEEPYPSS